MIYRDNPSYVWPTAPGAQKNRFQNAIDPRAMSEKSNPQNLPQTAMFRRDGKILKDVPLNLVVPGIKSGKLLPDDEISADGKKWTRLDGHPHLAKYFEPRSGAPASPKLPDIHFIRPKEFEASCGYSSVQDPIVQSPDGNWILYAKSNFPLTVAGAKKATAQALKNALDQLCFPEEANKTDNGTAPRETGATTGENDGREGQDDYEKYLQEIFLTIVRHNLRCREADAFADAFKPRYLALLQEKIKTTYAWEASSEEEREDLLETLKPRAIESLDILCEVNLQALIEGRKLDLNTTALATEKYGAETLHFYFKKMRAGGLDMAHKIGEDERDDLAMFERLLEKDLAVRGEWIPVENMLGTFATNEMWAMIYDLHPPEFIDKKQAIKFLMDVPDIRARLKKALDFNLLFQLKPLPEKVCGRDFKTFAKAFEYAYEVSSLMFFTQMGADFNLQTFKSACRDIETWWVANDNCCPHCEKNLKNQYPKDTCPILPLHVGCNCYISAEPIRAKSKDEETNDR